MKKTKLIHPIVSFVIMVRSVRIRSNYQRRILDWLSDGGGTVTEVSENLGILVPHVSATLKKLRETGDVVRDDQNLRGSKYRISSKGLDRIESDNIRRLVELVQWPPPPGAAGIVLSRDGPMLILGYVTKPHGPLLGLPSRPMDEEIGTIQNSTGNEGESWIWAVQRGIGPTWWDVESLRKTEPPQENTPLTLAAWMDRPKVIGIIRAKLLDDGLNWPLSVGSWFESMPDGYWPDLPIALTDGDVKLGRAGNTGPAVSPRGGIQSKLGSRSSKSRIFSKLAQESLVIADSDLLGKDQSPLPIEVLKNWIEIQHPRLRSEAVSEKYQKLVVDLKRSSSNSVTRKLLHDFPGRVFESYNGNILDTRGISSIGGEAILKFALENSQKPIILDWRWSGSIPLLDVLAEDSRCRLINLESKSLPLPFVLTYGNDIGKFLLEMPGRLYIPISLDENFLVPKGWKIPENPTELVRGKSKKVPDADSETQAIWQACQLLDGDDEWADRHENQFPLAAWIASSKQNLPSRWRRLNKKIDPIWTDMANLEDFDDLSLVELAEHHDPALDILMERLRSHPYQLISNHSDSPALATAMLMSRQWIEVNSEIVHAWLKNPIRVNDVLKLNWHSKEINDLVESCAQHKALLTGSELDRNQILAIMEDVDYSLWNSKSLDWLILALSSNSGRASLSQLDIPWPAVLCDSEVVSDQIMLVHHMPEGIGKDSLLDVLEGLTARETGRTPARGRTHPFASWLFMEKAPQIPVTTNHNLHVHLALHRRFQQ